MSFSRTKLTRRSKSSSPVKPSRAEIALASESLLSDGMVRKYGRLQKSHSFLRPVVHVAGKAYGEVGNPGTSLPATEPFLPPFSDHSPFVQYEDFSVPSSAAPSSRTKKAKQWARWHEIIPSLVDPYLRWLASQKPADVQPCSSCTSHRQHVISVIYFDSMWSLFLLILLVGNFFDRD